MDCKKLTPYLLQEIIFATLNVELNKHNGKSFKLSQLKPGNIIPEMEFHIHSPDFSFEKLGQNLEKHSNNKFVEYLLNKKMINSLQIDQQFFKGFIDLTLK